MISKNIIYLLVATSIVSSVVTYSFCKYRLKIPEKTDYSILSQPQTSQSNDCNYKIERLEGYKYIRPINYAEPECETLKYLPLKAQVQNKIDEYKYSNNLTSASVYFRGFNLGNWININPDEQYHPASLLKLPLLITLLKTDESTPGFLNKRLTFSQKLTTTRIQTFNSHQIQFGKSYTIRELLQYMVSYSDNNATNLLHQVMDAEEHKKTFYKLGLPICDVTKLGYTISAKDYSTFLKVLFSGSYLNHEHSEFAFELLAKTDFDDGLKAGLPGGTLVAHKFGEWTDGKSIRELHESGVIYLNGKAFLLTIMTSGTNVKQLTGVIAGITKTVYDYLDNLNKLDISYIPKSKDQQSL